MSRQVIDYNLIYVDNQATQAQINQISNERVAAGNTSHLTNPKRMKDVIILAEARALNAILLTRDQNILKTFPLWAEDF